MSAPNTDPEKQAKRHKGPLSGIILVVVFAIVLLIGLAIYVTYRGNTPGNDQPIGTDQAETLGEPGGTAGGEAGTGATQQAE